MKRNSSGFGIIAYILGFIGIMAFGTMIFTSQSGQDQKMVSKETQLTTLVQQAEAIRNSARRCASHANRAIRSMSNSNPEPIVVDGYPSCLEQSNIPGVTGSCVIEEGTLEADLPNVYCDAFGQYLFDPQQSNFHLTPLAGFGKWKYRKVEEVGVILEIDALPSNDQAAEIISQAKESFVANELYAVAGAPANPNKFSIYIAKYLEEPVVGCEPNCGGPGGQTTLPGQSGVGAPGGGPPP